MAEIKIPKIPDALVISSAMTMHAYAEGEDVNPALAREHLCVVPSVDADKLSQRQKRRMFAAEMAAQGRAVALAQVALQGVGPDILDQPEPEPRRGFLAGLFSDKPVSSFSTHLSPEDFEPGGAIDIVRSSGRIGSK